MNIRIIPRLDIKGPKLVKGIHLEGLRVMGPPEIFAKHYYEQGADELIYMDIVASLYGRNSLLSIIETTSREIFIPLTVGGGIRSLEDIRTVLRSGADKVSLNTAAIAKPAIISEAAEIFGTSTIVVSIEAKQQRDGTYECYTDTGRERTGKDVFEWAEQVEALGAGEIMVTSIDREGTGNGFDIELVSRIAKKAKIPVIASGGSGNLGHITEVIEDGFADAVAVASIFHYNSLNRFKKEKLPEFENNSISGYSRITPSPIDEIKRGLQSANIPCRS